MTILRQKSHMVNALFKFKLFSSMASSTSHVKKLQHEFRSTHSINSSMLQCDCFWINLITVAHWLYSYCLMSVKKSCSSMNTLLFVFVLFFMVNSICRWRINTGNASDSLAHVNCKVIILSPNIASTSEYVPYTYWTSKPHTIHTCTT